MDPCSQALLTYIVLQATEIWVGPENNARHNTLYSLFTFFHSPLPPLPFPPPPPTHTHTIIYPLSSPSLHSRTHTPQHLVIKPAHALDLLPISSLLVFKLFLPPLLLPFISSLLSPHPSSIFSLSLLPSSPPYQMDPPVYSELARKYGLHVSLLERLYDHETYDSGIGQLCKTLLTENHRSHQQVQYQGLYCIPQTMNDVWSIHVCMYILYSLVPRPLPDFISQPWRKIGRRPGIKTMSQTGNGGLGSTNRVHVTYQPSPPFPVRDVVLLPGLLPIFLYGCEIKSGRGLGTRLYKYQGFVQGGGGAWGEPPSHNSPP